MFKKFNIQTKIVLPYTLLFAVVIAAVSLITIRIIYKRIDERIERQMEHVAEVVSSMNFIMSDDFLNNIKIREVLGADIIIYRPDGEVIATTLPRNGLDETVSAIRSADVESYLLKMTDASPIRNIHYLNQPYKVIYHQLKGLSGNEHAILSIMVSTEDIDLAKKQSAITIGLVSASGILLITIIGSIIAISITAPVKQLVEVTERVAAGDLTVESTVKTRDEIGVLARSFNQMTKDLKMSRDKLVQSEKLAVVGQLAAGIAHEIRNPLTSMKMVVQLLRKKVQDDESAQESLQVVLDEINRLDIVINSLLDFARPMELILKPANLMDIMDDVLKLMEANLRHRKIELTKYEDKPIPEIMLDENRMKQVFMNIILNSMQAMPEGGKLIIRCHYNDEDHITQIEIADTGIGMSQDVLANAFEPFFSAKSGGTGMGLANVKKIVEQHGGSIQIESIEGQETKVIIKFELSQKVGTER